MCCWLCVVCWNVCVDRSLLSVVVYCLSFIVVLIIVSVVVGCLVLFADQ